MEDLAGMGKERFEERSGEVELEIYFLGTVANGQKKIQTKFSVQSSICFEFL